MSYYKFPKSGATELDVVAFLDTNLLDCSVSNVPASASSPLEVVASMVSDVKKIEIVDDIGVEINLYIGAASFEILKTNLPLGGGTIEVKIPEGSRVSLRATENVAIATGKMRMNFLG